VLDPDPVARAALRRALAARRFSVLTAADGRRGMTRLLDTLLGLDVLIIDQDLPGRDARAFTRLVRDAGGERDLAIVVRAEAVTPALRAELLALGADAVVDRAEGADAVAAAALTLVTSVRPASSAAPAAPPTDADTGGWHIALGRVAAWSA
jgi:CheY-like chemotaxis protein